MQRVGVFIDVQNVYLTTKTVSHQFMNLHAIPGILDVE